jgi:hypothetical protein
MKEPLPLISAIGFLVAAGASIGLYGLWGAPIAVFAVPAAVWLLRDRDRQLAIREEDELLDILDALGPRPREGGAPR